MQEEKPSATGALALSDGSLYWGRGFGAEKIYAGELVFNTAMTGYQEILTDPSYAGQIVSFTFPHIGITGTNLEDYESVAAAAGGMICRNRPTLPSSWRHHATFDSWMAQRGIVGLYDIDTRAVTHRLRNEGSLSAAIQFSGARKPDADKLIEMARSLPSLSGQDLTPLVTSKEPSTWLEGGWTVSGGYDASNQTGPEIVVIDYGVKNNILRSLAARNCKITLVPSTTKASDILAMRPEGIVLSNGPGDPAATGAHAVSRIQELVRSGVPLFGICLGSQMLGLALGTNTSKMTHGHHGANHPVQDLQTGRVEITSQNHGFTVSDENLPEGVEVTHRSLFDQTIQGIALKDKPVFSVQYHPEASPGPSDSDYLFDRFLDMVRQHQRP